MGGELACEAPAALAGWRSSPHAAAFQVELAAFCMTASLATAELGFAVQAHPGLPRTHQKKKKSYFSPICNLSESRREKSSAYRGLLGAVPKESHRL